MADDQSNKASTIDDLVKELSRPQGEARSAGAAKNDNSNQPPSNLPGIKIDNKPTIPAMPPRPMQSPLSASTGGNLSSRPQMPSPSSPGVPQPPSPPLLKPQPSQAQPQPQPQPTSPPLPFSMGQSKPAPTQEYKSSIRTMGEDISSIKSGQKPAGVDIPRKIAPEARPPMPGIQKPVTPPAGGPISSIGLGRAEKTSPLPFTPTPKGPEMPKPPVVIQPPIVVPGEKKWFLSPIFYMLIAGVLVVGGFMYWFFVLRVPEPEVVVSPTPSPTLSATPSVKNLSEIFGGSPVNFEVSLSENIGSDFKTFVNTLEVSTNEFLKVDLIEETQDVLILLNFLDVFDMVLIDTGPVYPGTFLKDNVLDSVTTIYSQSETFKQDGTIDFNAQGSKKVTFIAKINDKIEAERRMKDWEPTIADDLADFLLITDTAKEASVNYLDNTYRGIPIRYKNFPFADSTVDYSIVDSNGQSYLVIAGSREATYAAIDVLLEQ